MAQTEALATLALVLLSWTIEPKLRPGESITTYKERVFEDAALVGTAFTLKHVPLSFVKRSLTAI